MTIRTVCGDISGEGIGMMSMHEHLYGDFWNGYYEDIGILNDSVNQPITLQNYGQIRRNPGALKENLLVTDTDLTVRELRYFKEAGGGLIVNPLGRGIRRSNPEALVKISKESGVHVVAGTGYYIYSTLRDDEKRLDEEEMTELCIKDIRDGIDGTGIRAGVIGEIGALGEMDAGECKILRAAAKTASATNASIILHTACPSTLYDSDKMMSWKERTCRVIDFLESNGADPGRIVVGHPDVSEMNPFEDQVEILKRGVILEYDNFGQEHPYDRENTYALTDWTRIQNIIRFIELGYLNSIVMATDLWQKIQYREYGGWGFDHIISNVIPMMKRCGVSDKEVEQIMISTPTRLLMIEE